MVRKIQYILVVITLLSFMGCTPSETNESGDNIVKGSSNNQLSINKADYTEIKCSEMYEIKGD